MYTSRLGMFAGLMLAFAITVAPTQAAEKKADLNKEQIRRLQQVQRKLEQEKAALEQERGTVAAELGEVKKKADAEARRAGSLRKELDALTTEKDAVAAKLTETEAELRKTQEQQRATDGERKRLETLTAKHTKSIANCEDHNAKLHSQGVALLEKYQSKTCFDAILQAEPFTGLRRVEIENFVEDNRENFDEHKLDRQARR